MIKKFFCLAGIVLGGILFNHLNAESTRYGQWNQNRQEAEQRLTAELQTYQACANGRCWGAAAFRQEQLVRVGAAQVNAIRILQQKPGGLTAAEERRLADYSALFGRISTVPISPLPVCTVGKRCAGPRP